MSKNEQTSIFDFLCDGEYKITKPIRLIEMFAGYGSQALALKYLGVNFEHWKIAEWAIKSIQAYKDMHLPNDNTNYSEKLSDDEVVDKLYKKGISKDYNNPATKEEIKRIDFRKTYNNICATNNLVSVCNIHAKDLNMVDRDKFTYLLVYSFPCQDLSLAGKRKGCEKGSGTRSGLLWEIERILDECNGELPHILLMENVPELIRSNNKKDFLKWEQKLNELGYKNYVQILNATDYGIPQSRRRVFMLSILGNYNYKFPSKIKLEKHLKDLLEDKVDEKYYLSDKMIKYIVANNENWTGNNNKSLINKSIASTINTGEGSRRCDASNYVAEGLPENTDLKCIIKENNESDISKPIVVGNYSPSGHNATRVVDSNGIAPTAMGNHGSVTAAVVACAQRGRNDKQQLEIFDREVANTLTTVNKDSMVAIFNEPRVIGGIGNKCNNDTQYHQQNRIYDNNITISCTTSFNPYYVDYDLRIRKLTPKECFRLMGVKDEDYERVAKNQSESSLYHLAGDSIVVNVLMAIFSKLF